jgi:hypothetical protein
LHPAEDCGERSFRIRGPFRDYRTKVIIFEVIPRELRCAIFEPSRNVGQKAVRVENEA